MQSKVLTYTGTEVSVRYDVKRCIHAAECVHQLPRVFDPNRKPWVEPDHAAAEQLLQVVTRCPTGALRAERIDGRSGEQPPAENTATTTPNGPVYVCGDFQVVTQAGKVLLEDTRVALCRCGSSDNKPLCDGRHAEVGFRDDGQLKGEPQPPQDRKGGNLRITVLPDGPLLFDGHLEIVSSSGIRTGADKGALCRCGASHNKPFCDGSHSKEGFSAE